MTTTKKITRKIDINAPVDRVFAFLTDPNHLLEVMPSLVEVANIDKKAEGGHSFDYVYKMAGLRLHGHSATSLVEKNKRIIVRNTGGVPSTFDYGYEAVGKGMRLTLTVDYSVPGAVIAKLAEPIVHRLNEHEADLFLQNVKTRIEMGKPATDEARPSVH
jgi:carbon monoxide dehydrogenase subunit G